MNKSLQINSVLVNFVSSNLFAVPACQAASKKQMKYICISPNLAKSRPIVDLLELPQRQGRRGNKGAESTKTGGKVCQTTV